MSLFVSAGNVRRRGDIWLLEDKDLVAQVLGRARERLVLHNLLRKNGRAEFAEDIRRGLSAQPKQLFAKYLYDDLGSQLFEAICQLDEYYLTRAEDEIFSNHADEIIDAIP